MRDLDVRFRTPDGDGRSGARASTSTSTRGETVAIVGESGSGKSQTMMAAMGLLASNGAATGSAGYRGDELIGLAERELNRIRGVKITMIFQEPMTSLDPLYTIGSQIAEPIMLPPAACRRRGARARPSSCCELVGIPEPGAAHRRPIRTNCPAASASA